MFDISKRERFRTIGELKEILTSVNPKVAFENTIANWYYNDCKKVYEEVKEKIIDCLAAENILYKNGISDSDDDYFDECLRELLNFKLPKEHYLKQKFCADVIVDTGDSNYDFTLNCIYPSYCSEKGVPINNKASIVWLVKQQGYTKTQLEKVLHSDNATNTNVFLESVKEEIAGISTNM